MTTGLNYPSYFCSFLLYVGLRDIYGLRSNKKALLDYPTGLDAPMNGRAGRLIILIIAVSGRGIILPIGSRAINIRIGVTFTSLHIPANT